MNYKLTIQLLITLTLGLVWASCRFSRPLVVIPLDKKNTIDSLTQTKKTIKESTYLSLRFPELFSHYRVDKEYNKTGTLSKLTIKKYTKYCNRRHTKFPRFNVQKTKYFNSNSEITQIDYKLSKCKKNTNKIIVDKNVIFENGKKKSTKNNLIK